MYLFLITSNILWKVQDKMNKVVFHEPRSKSQLKNLIFLFLSVNFIVNTPKDKLCFVTKFIILQQSRVAGYLTKNNINFSI
jgi:hypothetical protein